MNGTYNTKDIDHPKYDFGLKIEDLSIKQAATSFSIVKTYAPVAGLMTGNFGTDFKINGELGKDMMPKMNTVNGSGIIKIAQASLTESKLYFRNHFSYEAQRHRQGYFERCNYFGFDRKWSSYCKTFRREIRQLRN